MEAQRFLVYKSIILLLSLLICYSLLVLIKEFNIFSYFVNGFTLTQTPQINYLFSYSIVISKNRDVRGRFIISPPRDKQGRFTSVIENKTVLPLT